ncbi:MAG: thiamine phosphate synthase, partial [Planctomycetota bacterium]
MDEAELRIIDANLNRAREALRVIEDYARYGRDDADAAGRLKACRHRIREIAAEFDGTRLLAARDIVHDVGRDTKTPGELRRAGAEEVLRAAFARLAEALRSLGEFAKPHSHHAAELAERVRYDAYAVEQLLMARGPRRERLRTARVYVLLTEQLCRGHWLDTAEACLRGGADCLQLREKTLSDRELLARARRLRESTRRHNALLFINDRADIARLADADGVHLGRDDLTVRDARRILGGEALVGVTIHAGDAPTIDADVDAVAVGPMHPSATKPDVPVAGLDLLREWRRRVAAPLLAIGGITPENAREAFDAGAD